MTGGQFDVHVSAYKKWRWSDFDAHVSAYDEWRWSDDAWRARLLAEMSACDAVVLPRLAVDEAEACRLLSPAHEFSGLWAKVRPVRGAMPSISPRSADETHEIVARLFNARDLIDPNSRDAADFDALVERVRLSMPPTRRRAGSGEMRANLVHAVAESLAGAPISRRRGARAKPLHAREVTTDAAILSIYRLNLPRDKCAQPRGSADQSAGEGANITAKGVEKARGRARRN